MTNKQIQVWRADCLPIETNKIIGRMIENKK